MTYHTVMYLSSGVKDGRHPSADAALKACLRKLAMEGQRSWNLALSSEPQVTWLIADPEGRPLAQVQAHGKRDAKPLVTRWVNWKGRPSSDGWFACPHGSLLTCDMSEVLCEVPEPQEGRYYLAALDVHRAVTSFTALQSFEDLSATYPGLRHVFPQHHAAAHLARRVARSVTPAPEVRGYYIFKGEVQGGGVEFIPVFRANADALTFEPLPDPTTWQDPATSLQESA